MRARLATNSSGGVDLLWQAGDAGEIVRCGIEVGALDSFFSMEKPNLTKDRKAIIRTTKDPESCDSWVIRAEVEISGASFDLEEVGSVLLGSGFRKLKITMIKDSRLMDAVIRFVFPLSVVEGAFLGKRCLPHKRQNRYHQVPIRNVLMKLTSGSTITFKPIVAECPIGMAPFVYLRDEPDAWVFHVRLQATRPDVFVFKGCSRFYNKPFPAWMQQLVSSVPGFFRQTLYIRERISQRIPFQTNGAVLLEKGSRVSLSVAWEVQNEA